MFEIVIILLLSFLVIQVFSLISPSAPIAPHLSVYNEQEASSSSIMHRITGFLLSIPFLFIFLWEKAFTMYFHDIVGDFVREFRKLPLENQILVKVTHPSIKPYYDKLDFSIFYPKSLPFYEDGIMQFIGYSLYMVVITSIFSFFIAVLYHALHGVQHWFWDDFVTTSSFSISRGPIISGMYEHAVWALWVGPFWIAHAHFYY